MDITIENRGNRTSLKEFQKDLLLEGLLRLKPLEKKNIRNLSLEEFIYKFLSDYSKRIITVNVPNEDLQTDIGKRRSAGDIFRICKYYYPSTTLEDVLKVLDAISGDNNIYSSICYMIHKRTYRHEEKEDKDGDVYDTSIKDEFNRLPGQYIRN